MNNEMELLLKEEERLFQNVGVGRILKGKIMLEKQDEYYVDLNYKTDGILPKSEVVEDEKLEIGQEIVLKVVKVDGNSGEVLLSQKKAEEVNVWSQLEIGQIIEVKVVEKVEKGFICEYRGNIRGFIPLSHIDIKYSNEIDFEKYKGKKIKVEVIDVIPSKKRLVLSIKNILIKEEKEKKIEFMNSIKEGEIYTGIIKDIKDYGIFVDLGLFTGLVHKSEISWDRNLDLSKLYKSGDKVKVQILDFDREKERLGLSIKSLEKNPWDEFIENYKSGDVLEGVIRNIKDFGVFVKLNNSIDGFVHISNISYEFVKSPKDVVKLGDTVNVKILSIDTDKKKVELTMNLNQEEI